MKLLLTSAATALVMGTTAYAESHSMGLGAFEVTADDFYASNLMGMRVYASEQELGANGDMIDFAEQEWDDIGEINDLVISEDGAVGAVIVGVGGFLGIGEKDVAITMDQIRTYDDENGERFLVINATQESLEAAPGFERASMDETAMTDGEAAEPGMVEQTSAAATAAATATMIEDEEAVTVPADGSTTTTDIETETVEGESEMTEAETVETEMAETAPAADTGMATGTGTAATTGMIERDGYTTTAVSDLSTEELNGASVYGADDDNVGEIEELVASDAGEIEQAVIGVGGFLGIGEKRVAVNFSDLQILTNEDGSDIRVYISATEDELKALPEYQAPEEAAMESEMGTQMETETGTEIETEMETETAPAAQ